MGDPKKQRKKYERPRFLWRTDVIQGELALLGQYGLRNKRELWRHKTMLSKFRGIARSLIGKTLEERRKMEKTLMQKLKKLGILHQAATIDDVLDLSIEDILERRLQTFVFRKGLATSIYQSRQFIVHGHIAIGERRVTVPSYLVQNEEADHIKYAPQSTLAKPDHPIRQQITVTTSTQKEGPEQT